MDSITKQLTEALITAEQEWKAANHILMVTFPVVQDPKLLLRALEHIDKSVRGTISLILKREYVYKRVRLSKEGAENMRRFFSSCVAQYGVSDADSELLKELLDWGSRHKASGVEFSQKGKVIILDDEKGSVSVTAQSLNEQAAAVRRLQLALWAQFKES